MKYGGCSIDNQRRRKPCLQASMEAAEERAFAAEVQMDNAKEQSIQLAQLLRDRFCPVSVFRGTKLL